MEEGGGEEGGSEEVAGINWNSLGRTLHERDMNNSPMCYLGIVLYAYAHVKG